MYIYLKYATIAHLVERYSEEVEVFGSIPNCSTKQITINTALLDECFNCTYLVG